MNIRNIVWGILFISLCGASLSAKPVHHFVFFSQDREKIKEASSFLETKSLEGAQITYPWRLLEPGKDEYDFSAIREDLAFLNSKGKKLFIQLQDVTFSEKWVGVPRYLLRDAVYNGGADKQYEVKGGDEDHAVVAGWAARRWDPAVQERFHKLLFALGKEFDGRIEGINFAESSVGFGESGRLFPKGFSFEIYRDAIITNMKALKRAFPKSVAIQYANFMPGEWRPTKDKGYLRAVYQAAKELGVGVGGPDLRPYREGQLKSSYPLIREAAGIVPIGIAVQDGNYEDVDPKTGQLVTIAELIKFATEYLKVDYIFWCTQEPYYSEHLIPFMGQTGSKKQTHVLDSVPDPRDEEIRKIRTGKRWQNPYVMVYADGFELILHDRPRTPERLSLAELEKSLLHLALERWPLGRVVAAQEIAIRSAGDDEKIARNFAALKRMLQSHKVRVDLWPTA